MIFIIAGDIWLFILERKKKLVSFLYLQKDFVMYGYLYEKILRKKILVILIIF
jgi:hypothetical protein